jgi:hypothetical protein
MRERILMMWRKKHTDLLKSISHDKATSPPTPAPTNPLTPMALIPEMLLGFYTRSRMFCNLDGLIVIISTSGGTLN